MSRFLSPRSPILYIGLVLTIALGVATFGWYRHLTAAGSSVAGNVTYAGVPIGGMPADGVARLAEERAGEVLSLPIRVVTPDGSLSVPTAELGFDYDTDVAVERALATRHRGGLFDQFASWTRTWFRTDAVEEPLLFDPDRARASLEGIDRLVYQDPVEPQVEVGEDFRLAVVPGVEGQIADIEALVDQLGRLDPLEGRPLEVDASPVPLPPEFGDDRAQVVVDEMNDLTVTGVRLIIGGRIKQMSPAQVRRHMYFEIENDRMVPGFDYDSFQAEIEEMFPEPVGQGTVPTFEIQGEDVSVLTPGVPPEVCCSPDTAEKIANAIFKGLQGPLVLTSRPEDDPDQIAWYDGSEIVEQVSTFTTPHNCCESRVINIQRMADIVRGYYLVPGAVLSLNDYVGPRTAEKGFVPAGAIRAGHLTPEIGGGVSQFATTIFNAAYFAGMDFLEYRAHSLYFSRYPYGREATISNPAPDLVIKNTTDYPVLIWTSYTGNSITVSMYSTKNIEVAQIATRTAFRNQCRYVETDRERVYSDGRTVIDTFFALYRPADGVDCNGNPIPEVGD